MKQRHLASAPMDPATGPVSSATGYAQRAKRRASSSQQHGKAIVGALLFIVTLVLWFGTLGYRDLIHPDEGRYAEIARQMLVSGDWVTPRLNGILYFEKPALVYWATALSFQLFGFNEFAARLWPGITGALAVLAIWWFGRRPLGTRGSLYAACVLMSCTWWIANAHFLNLDTSLSAFLAIALFAFCDAQRDNASAVENRSGMLLTWAAMALAVLSKGLIGILIPGAVLVLYSLLTMDFRIWRRMHWGKGLLVFFAIAAPWFVLVSMRNPEFAHFFFIHEHFERFLTTQHRRTGGWGYFADDLLAGMLPWTTFLPFALLAGWRREPGRFQASRLMVIWSLFILAFFSASSSKLPSYILPMFPALAVLVAQRLESLPVRRLGSHATVVAVLAALAALAAACAPYLLRHRSEADFLMRARYAEWIAAGAVVLLFGAAASARLARARSRTGAIVALGLTGLVAVQLVLLGHQNFATLKSARTMVGQIQASIAPQAPFYSVQMHDQTLPFYLGRTVTLVDWRDEFSTGLDIEPDRAVHTIADFEARWMAQPGAVAMMKPDRHAEFARGGLPMQELYRDADRVVVIRPPVSPGSELERDPGDQALTHRPK